MKRLLKIILVIILNLAILSNIYAYDLTDSDKKVADTIVSKLESFIFKKGEDYRSILVEKVKKIDSSKSEKIKAYVDYILSKIEVINNFESKKELKVENNNVVLYENAKKVKALTIDGNGKDFEQYKFGNIEPVSYKIFSNSNFSIIKMTIGYFQEPTKKVIGGGWFLFDNKKGNELVNFGEFSEDKLEDIVYPPNYSLEISGDKLKIYGDTSYPNLNCKEKLAEINNGYITNTFFLESIKKYGIKILKENKIKTSDCNNLSKKSYDDLIGKYELLLDYKDLFN